MRPFRGSLEPGGPGVSEDAARAAQTDYKEDGLAKMPLSSTVHLSPGHAGCKHVASSLRRYLINRAGLEGGSCSATRSRVICVCPHTQRIQFTGSLLSEREVCGATLLLRVIFPRRPSHYFLSRGSATSPSARKSFIFSEQAVLGHVKGHFASIRTIKFIISRRRR